MLSLLADPGHIVERDSPCSKGAHGPGQRTNKYSVVASDWSVSLILMVATDEPAPSLPSWVPSMVTEWHYVSAAEGLWGPGIPG